MAEGLDALTFFLGEWDRDETGKAGVGVGFRTYRRVVGDRFVELRNTSTYQPQELNPDGEVHEDLGIFSYDDSANHATTTRNCAPAQLQRTYQSIGLTGRSKS